MKRLPLTILFPVLLLAGASCSVKEDRDVCPAQLVVCLDRVPTPLRDSPLRLEIRSEDRAVHWRSDVLPADGPVCLRVPRGNVRIDAVWDSESLPSAKSVFQTSGTEADSLFAYASNISCFSESVSDTVYLHKQWCNLTLKLLHPEIWEGYHMEICGRWNGLDLETMTPIPGQMRIQPKRVSMDTYQARILRQGDDGLNMQIFDGDKGPDPVASIPLGEMMRMNGYDWTDEDLPDVTLTIDPTQATIEVDIAPWDESTPFGEITI